MEGLNVWFVVLRDVMVDLNHLLVLVHLVVDVHQLVASHRVQLDIRVLLHHVPEIQRGKQRIEVDVCFDRECVGLHCLVLQFIERLQHGMRIGFDWFELV